MGIPGMDMADWNDKGGGYPGMTGGENIQVLKQNSKL